MVQYFQLACERWTDVSIFWSIKRLIELCSKHVYKNKHTQNISLDPIESITSLIIVLFSSKYIKNNYHLFLKKRICLDKFIRFCKVYKICDINKRNRKIGKGTKKNWKKNQKREHTCGLGGHFLKFVYVIVEYLQNIPYSSIEL